MWARAANDVALRRGLIRHRGLLVTLVSRLERKSKLIVDVTAQPVLRKVQPPLTQHAAFVASGARSSAGIDL
jgi:hypothetical protein